MDSQFFMVFGIGFCVGEVFMYVLRAAFYTYQIQTNGKSMFTVRGMMWRCIFGIVFGLSISLAGFSCWLYNRG